MAANNALRSRRQPVVRNPLAPVVESVFATPQGKLYPVFNGTTHYATIPAWKPVSALWQVCAECAPGSSGLTQRILSDASAPNWRLGKAPAGDVRLYYADNTAAAQQITFGTLPSNTRAFYTASVAPSGVSTYTNGAFVASQGFAPATLSAGFDSVGATAAGVEPMVGDIYSVCLTDRTPLQGARFMPGAATRAAHISVPQLPTGSKVRFWYKHAVTGVEQTVIGSTEASKLFYVHATDLFLFTPDVTVKVDGVAITNGTFAVTGGQHYLIELTIVNARTITHLGTAATDTGGISGTIGAIELENATTGDKWTYTGRNDSGNVLVCGGNAGYGEYKFTPQLANPSHWEEIPGGWRRINDSAFSQFILEPYDSASNDRVIEVELCLKRLSGVNPISVYYRNQADSAWITKDLGEGFVRILTWAKGGASAAFPALMVNSNQTKYEITQLRWRETPHGAWLQSGELMTDAAADAARTRLPMINREYIFDEPGRIREVVGGGADATLQGGLSITDWAPE